MVNSANIERLNDAIDALGEDAESLHELISRSTDELEKALQAGNRATRNAERVIRALGPLAEKMEARIDDAEALVESAKAASANQQRATAEAMEALRRSVGSTMDGLGAKIREERDSLSEGQNALAEALDGSIGAFAEKQSAKLNEFATKSLLESEKTRDVLLTDLLASKNATGARLDSLESQIVKLSDAVEEASRTTSSAIDGVRKKLSIAVYAAVAVGVANLAFLAFLMVR